jgi:lipoyl(octanoyl) transferase
MIFEYLDLVSYKIGLDQQKKSYDYVHQTGRPVLLGCEHYPVITLGKSADLESEVFFSKDILIEKGIEMFQIDRGGQATLHSPGQLVIYPIIPIRAYQLSVKNFIEILQQTTLECIKQFGITAFTQDLETGVFSAAGKVAFIGIRVDRGITRHGISLNINNNLELFSLIRPCGVSQPRLDSFEKQGKFPEIKEVYDVWAHIFALKLMDFRAKTITNSNNDFH